MEKDIYHYLVCRDGNCIVILNTRVYSEKVYLFEAIFKL